MLIEGGQGGTDREGRERRKRRKGDGPGRAGPESEPFARECALEEEGTRYGPTQAASELPPVAPLVHLPAGHWMQEVCPDEPW